MYIGAPSCTSYTRNNHLTLHAITNGSTGNALAFGEGDPKHILDSPVFFNNLSNTLDVVKRVPSTREHTSGQPQLFADLCLWA